MADELKRRTLQVGDRVWVGGGYDSTAAWMAAAGDDLGYPGTVLEFIPGQNLQPAPVIELDHESAIPGLAETVGGCGGVVRSPRGLDISGRAGELCLGP